MILTFQNSVINNIHTIIKKHLLMSPLPSSPTLSKTSYLNNSFVEKVFSSVLKTRFNMNKVCLHLRGQIIEVLDWKFWCQTSLAGISIKQPKNQYWRYPGECKTTRNIKWPFTYYIDVWHESSNLSRCSKGWSRKLKFKI